MNVKALALADNDDISLTANVLPFIDVDGTLLDYDGPRIVYCDYLINWLISKNLPKIVLLTNMNIREIYFLHPSRFDLIQHLSDRGIEVIAVITPLDVTFSKLGITKKMGDLYKKYFSPIEAALTKVKQVCDKNICNQFINLFTQKLFLHFKSDSCHNFSSVLSASLNDFDKTQVTSDQLTSLSALGQELFIYNVTYHTNQIDPKSATKGDAYLRYIGENPDLIEGRQIVFIDDTEKERLCVFEAHQRAALKNPLLVLPPPSDHKNQVTEAWERVHQHTSTLQYASYHQFSLSVSNLCRLSIFRQNSKVTYMFDELNQAVVVNSTADNENAREGVTLV